MRILTALYKVFSTCVGVKWWGIYFPRQLDQDCLVIWQIKHKLVYVVETEDRLCYLEIIWFSIKDLSDLSFVRFTSANHANAILFGGTYVTWQPWCFFSWCMLIVTGLIQVNKLNQEFAALLPPKKHRFLPFISLFGKYSTGFKTLPLYKCVRKQKCILKKMIDCSFFAEKSLNFDLYLGKHPFLHCTIWYI